MGTVGTWLIAGMLALLIGSGMHLDAGADHRPEFAQARQLEAEQRARALLARQLNECRTRYGANSVQVQLATGAVVCKTKRGHTVATLTRPNP